MDDSFLEAQTDDYGSPPALIEVSPVSAFRSENRYDPIESYNPISLSGYSVMEIGALASKQSTSSGFLAQPSPPSFTDELLKLSYETLIKQIYGIPIELPKYLFINNIRCDFIPFEQIKNMLLQNKIDRMVIDPLLQPWAGPPSSDYRILTFFGRDGMIYLVKAKYNSLSNRIYP